MQIKMRFQQANSLVTANDYKIHRCKISRLPGYSPAIRYGPLWICDGCLLCGFERQAQGEFAKGREHQLPSTNEAEQDGIHQHVDRRRMHFHCGLSDIWFQT